VYINSHAHIICFPRSGVIIYAISVAHIASLTLPFTECLSNVLHWRLFADDNPARIKPSGPCVVYANWDETDTVTDYVLGAVACAIRQCLCVTVRGVVAKPAHGGEAVAPAADGDAEPDAAGPPIRILHHQLKKQMTSLPPLGASHPRRRRGNSILSRLFQTTLISRSRPTGGTGQPLRSLIVLERCKCRGSGPSLRRRSFAASGQPTPPLPPR
jgi:hypothetical protein